MLNVPLDLVGGYYLMVVTDTDGAVQELDDVNNIALAAARTTFGRQQYPNLQVSSVQPPPEAFSGREAVITWTVLNAGGAATAAAGWMDRVWLSTDRILDAADVLLGEVLNPAYVTAGEGYASSLTARLPREAEDTYYVLVETDVGSRVFEFDSEGDNRTSSAAFTVALTPPPDLRVTVVAPLSTFSGEATTISWTVTNYGPGPTEVSAWSDEVFMSADDRWDASDLSLGRVARAGGLAKDETYTASLAVATPLDAQGSRYFLVRTDTRNEVFEQAFEGNNVGHDEPTAVNLTPPPDLEVTSVSAPPTAAGRTLAVTFRTENSGSTPTVGRWTNVFYLSTAPTLDPATAILLGRRSFPFDLTDGGGFQVVTESFDLSPATPAGDYYVFVTADADADLFELDDANNAGRTSDRVVITSRPADLRVLSVLPAGPLEAGRPVQFDYTIRNDGTGETNALAWTDQFYAVTPDGASEVYLGERTRYGMLAAGGSYTGRATLTVPFTLSGAYRLVVRTDAGGNVYETNETNNAGEVAVSIARRIPDLSVSGVTAGGIVQAGSQLSVNWQVTNVGIGETPNAFWYDRVSLVTGDGTIVADLGSVRRTNPLAAGASYAASGSFTVPTTVPAGSYLVRVTADGPNAVPEADEANNAALSPTPVSVTSPLPTTPSTTTSDLRTSPPRRAALLASRLPSFGP